MNLRRATIATHGLLAVSLVVAAAWLLWISFSYVPDPADRWPVGPDFLAVPMAVGLIGVIAVLMLAVRYWMRSGNRAALGVVDLLVAGALFLIGIAIPTPVMLGAFAVLVVAGATVAANRPASRVTLRDAD